MLTNQIALVTGASRGIGQAIANALGQQEAIVIGTATTEVGAQTISERLKTVGIHGTGMVLDVSDSISIKTCLQQISDKFGTPDILINNAGITRDNLLIRMKDDQWDDSINTNLTAVFRLAKAVIRTMLKKKSGRIINISSVVGVMGNAGQTNYAAAKAGLIGFSKSLVREIGARNITVNTIAPGFIDTDMTRGLAAEQHKLLTSQIPLGRLGNAEEVAAIVAFLASPSAGYITGETIHVNGGLYMP